VLFSTASRPVHVVLSERFVALQRLHPSAPLEALARVPLSFNEGLLSHHLASSTRRRRSCCVEPKLIAAARQPASLSSWRLTTLPWVFGSLRCFRDVQRPTPGLPLPAVLRLQALSASWRFDSAHHAAALFHAAVTLGITFTFRGFPPAVAFPASRQFLPSSLFLLFVPTLPRFTPRLPLSPRTRGWATYLKWACQRATREAWSLGGFPPLRRSAALGQRSADVDVPCLPVVQASLVRVCSRSLSAASLCEASAGSVAPVSFYWVANARSSLGRFASSGISPQWPRLDALWTTMSSGRSASSHGLGSGALQRTLGTIGRTLAPHEVVLVRDRVLSFALGRFSAVTGFAPTHAEVTW